MNNQRPHFPGQDVMRSHPLHADLRPRPPFRLRDMRTIRMTAFTTSNRRCSQRTLLAATLGVVILLFLWIRMQRPAGTLLGSNYKTPQGKTAAPADRLRSNRPKLNRFKPESTTRNQPDPSNTNYSKLNITYERVETNCSGVFISVRTTVKFHKSRLLLLLHTWLQTVDPKQVDWLYKSVSNLSHKAHTEFLFCRSRSLLIVIQ